jgi:hypothetical protein
MCLQADFMICKKYQKWSITSWQSSSEQTLLKHLYWSMTCYNIPRIKSPFWCWNSTNKCNIMKMKLINLHMSNEQQFYMYHRKRCCCSTCGASYSQLLCLVSYLMRIQVFLVVMLSSRILHSQYSFKLSVINNPATQHNNLQNQKPQISQVTSCEYWGFCSNVVDDSILLDMTSDH